LIYHGGRASRAMYEFDLDQGTNCEIAIADIALSLPMIED
jgi:hypothetical protein